MYETHFGFRQRPFRAMPDGQLYYPASGHERALAALLAAINDDENIALVTGEPGLGKTLLCYRLLERFVPDVSSALLSNSHFSDRASLLQAILYDLSLSFEGRGEQELRFALTDFLLANYAAGRRTVLVIDEAHYLSADHLEELRLLGNLEVNEGKALQVVLVAQPAIFDLLRQPQLTAFSQRLAVRMSLEPLSVHEAADYVLHQLRGVGARPQKVISDEAIDLLARETKGCPRLLNQVSHQAFSLACAAGNGFVDAEAVLEALSILQSNEESTIPLPTSNEVEESYIDKEEPAAPKLEIAHPEVGSSSLPMVAEHQEQEHFLFAPPRRPA